MNIQVDSRTITYGKDGSNKLTVRGLSTHDLTQLARKNMDQLTDLFDLAEKGLQGSDDDLADFKVFGLELLDKFPELVAQMIALSADAPDLAGECLKLPAPIQLKVIIAIYELTIEDTGGLEDFLALVITIFEKAKKVIS